MITIRLISEVQDAAFVTLIHAFWQELMPKAAVLATDESRAAYFEREFATGEVYGAYADAALVGYVHIDVRGGVGRVEGFYTTPSMRRRGIGTNLMRFAFAQFDARGVGQIDLYVRRDNPGAKAFYEALGFGVAGWRMRLYRADGETLPGVLSSD